MQDQRPEPKWAKVLDTLYDRDKGMVYEFDSDQEKVAHISNRHGRELADQEIENTLRYMADVRLIEGFGSESDDAFRLTSKGFDVAHERELDYAEATRSQQQHNEHTEINSRQTELNGVLTGLTLILAGTALLQTATALPVAGNQQFQSLDWILLAIAAGLVLFAAVTIRFPTKWQKVVSAEAGHKISE